jgi:hypothetical protein
MRDRQAVMEQEQNRNHRSSDIHFFCLGGGWHEKARNVISQEDACELRAEFFQPK